MTKQQIEQIEKDIAAYKQAIQDAQDALDAAERELDELLEAEAEREGLL